VEGGAVTGGHIMVGFIKVRVCVCGCVSGVGWGVQGQVWQLQIRQV
jgi:hypothetical protein